VQLTARRLRTAPRTNAHGSPAKQQAATYAAVAVIADYKLVGACLARTRRLGCEALGMTSVPRESFADPIGGDSDAPAKIKKGHAWAGVEIVPCLLRRR
jgi:hypothetical protein